MSEDEIVQPTWAPPPPAWVPPPSVPPPPLAGHDAAPVAENEREPLVDSLRGVALLGIVVVNVAAYRRGVGPNLAAAGGDVGGHVGPLTVGLSALAEGRFYPLFSFLFGWGFAVQDAVSRVRGRSVVGPWLRRMGVLWCFGMVHALLLFWGDILTTYAVIGVGLLIVRKLKPAVLAAIGAGLVFAQAVFSSGLDALLSLTVSNDGEGAFRADQLRHLGEVANVYAHGSFGSVVGERVALYRVSYVFGFLSVGGTVAGMMVLGMAAARVGWIDDRRWPSWLRTGIVPLWMVGVALSIPAAWLLGDGALGSADAGKTALGRFLYAALGPAMALLWAGLIVRAGDWSPARRVLDAIAPAGRMSLTIYLSQSLIASLVFNGYGFGLGDDVGIGGALAMVVALWFVQVLLATLWFRFFLMGPLEAVAVWAAAYLRWPPMRRSRSPANSLAAPTTPR